MRRKLIMLCLGAIRRNSFMMRYYVASSHVAMIVKTVSSALQGTYRRVIVFVALAWIWTVKQCVGFVIAIEAFCLDVEIEIRVEALTYRTHDQCLGRLS